MALYTTLASLSQTAASNAADGAVDAPSTIDQQTNLLASFIAQLRDGNGFTNSQSFRNRVRNPNFAVNQRAVSGSVVLAAGAYGHDGWKAGAAGCTYTFATSGIDTVLTITAGSLIQTIESVYIEGGNYAMSWTGTAQGKIGAGSYAATGVTATGVTANANLNIEFNTGTLGQVQLEPGMVATPFERKGYVNELIWCKRYLPVFRGSTGQSLVSGQCTSGTTALLFFHFDVEPRIVPSGIFSSGAAYLLTSSGAATGPISALTYSTASLRMGLAQATVSGLVAGNATMLSANSSSTVVIFTGCEL